MKTLEEVLEILDARIDRPALETYIARQWIRPVRRPAGWYFEDIDIARLRLVCHLVQEIEVNEEGVDVALSLLDQLYGLRAHMKHLTHAVTRQPPEIRTGILTLMLQMEKEERPGESTREPSGN